MQINLPETIEITIGKGAGTIEIRTETIPANIWLRLVQKGLEARANAAGNDIKKDDQGASEAVRSAAIDEIQSLQRGQWNANRTRGTSPIESKALELARNAIGLRLKDGLKVSKENGWTLRHESPAAQFFASASKKLNLPMETMEQMKSLHVAMIKDYAKRPQIVAEAEELVKKAQAFAEEIEF